MSRSPIFLNTAWNDDSTVGLKLELQFFQSFQAVLTDALFHDTGLLADKQLLIKSLFHTHF